MTARDCGFGLAEALAVQSFGTPAMAIKTMTGNKTAQPFAMCIPKLLTLGDTQVIEWKILPSRETDGSGCGPSSETDIYRKAGHMGQNIGSSP